MHLHTTSKIIGNFVFIFLLIATGCKNTNHSAVEQKDNGLQNKHVLITAPSNYAERLSQLIKEAGGIPVVLPAVETTINPNTSSIDSLLTNLNSFQWIVLPSRKAADAFFEGVQRNDIAHDMLSKINFCAIGNDINYLLDKYNTEVAFTPSESGPNGIVQVLDKLPGIQGKNLGLVAPQVIGVSEPNVIPNFIQNLKELGINVHKTEGYVTKIANPDTYQHQLDQLKNGQIDIIAFTSTAEIEALLKLSSSTTINRCQIACFGPYTGNNAKKLGINPAYVGKDYHSFSSFVNELSHFFATEK